MEAEQQLPEKVTPPSLDGVNRIVVFSENTDKEETKYLIYYKNPYHYALDIPEIADAILKRSWDIDPDATIEFCTTLDNMRTAKLASSKLNPPSKAKKDTLIKRFRLKGMLLDSLAKHCEALWTENGAKPVKSDLLDNVLCSHRCSHCNRGYITIKSYRLTFNLTKIVKPTCFSCFERVHHVITYSEAARYVEEELVTDKVDDLGRTLIYFPTVYTTYTNTNCLLPTDRSRQLKPEYAHMIDNVKNEGSTGTFGTYGAKFVRMLLSYVHFWSLRIPLEYAEELAKNYFEKYSPTDKKAFDKRFLYRSVPSDSKEKHRLLPLYKSKFTTMKRIRILLEYIRKLKVDAGFASPCVGCGSSCINCMQTHITSIMLQYKSDVGGCERMTVKDLTLVELQQNRQRLLGSPPIDSSYEISKYIKEKAKIKHEVYRMVRKRKRDAMKKDEKDTDNKSSSSDEESSDEWTPETSYKRNRKRVKAYHNPIANNPSPSWKLVQSKFITKARELTNGP